MDRVVIGTRGSLLARTQSDWVAAQLRAQWPDFEVVIEHIATRGDKIRDVPLAQVGGKGLFTKEIEVALLDGRVDLAVHSLKDLPTELPEGLALGAVPVREDPRDALVSKGRATLDALPSRARVGTSSLRRRLQLITRRPDLEVVDLRGNVPTRLRRVSEGDLDAAVLAAAGLRRLGQSAIIAQALPPEVMLPAAGQGALGIEIRADDERIMALLGFLQDSAAAAEVAAERALLAALGGGCQTPVGALGRVEGDLLRLYAGICDPDGGRVLRTEIEGRIEDAGTLGRRAAEVLLRMGAAEFVHRTTA
ncbi:MAG TPA: hydroxymethylbilane synthase, partial [Candidatus Hydrogenedentes bacterium]|nr:hydroxymethylbilane synthase [Candidatus Hydrogenedentota bacterium]